MRIEAHRRRKEMYQAHRYISKNLRLLRYIRGLSQQDAACLLHMSRSCYCQLESGSKLPDLITIYEISRFFDVSLDYLLSFDMTEHLLFLMKRDRNELQAQQFIGKYLKLSHGARKQINTRIAKLMDQEKEFNFFPWDYDMEEDI